MRQNQRRIKMVLPFFLCLCMLSGCTGTQTVLQPLQETQAEEIMFGQTEAVRIMGEAVSMPEYMLYAVDVQQAYDADMSGKDERKVEIAEAIRLVKVCCAAAGEYGITLTQEEQSVLQEEAALYAQDLVEGGVDAVFLPETVIQRFLTEEYLSQKVYAHITEECGGEETAVTATLVGLLQKYDGDYDSATHINWELMDTAQF